MPPATNQPSSITFGGYYPCLALQWAKIRLQALRQLALRRTAQLQILQAPLTRRQINNNLPSATAIPHPPPPYTPTISLHAPTLAPNMVDPSLPTLRPGSGPVPTSPPAQVNSRAVLGVVLLCSIVIIFAASAATLFIKRRKIKLNLSTFKNALRGSKQRGEHIRMDEVDDMKLSEEDLAHPTGNLYRTSDVLGYYHSKRGELDDEDTHPEMVPTHRLPGMPEDLADPSPRRYSSPSIINVEIATGSFSPDPALPRPTSMPPPERQISIYVQQQKVAELAQIARMKVVRDESFATNPSSLAEGPEQLKRASASGGLGFVHDNGGIDIGSTVLSTLQSYSLATGAKAPITDLFKVNAQGTFVYTNRCSFPQSKSEQDSFGSSGSEVSMAETDIVDGGIVELRMAHTRSMEIKRGVLVSLGPSSTDVPHLLVSHPSSKNSICPLSTSRTSSLNVPHAEDYLRPESPTALDYEMADFPSPPPVLSPILPSSFALSDEIEKSLGDQVFSGRDSGLWPQDGYHLSTPGQIRALVDALDLGDPNEDNRNKSGWTTTAIDSRMSAA
ncbi:hypothetical protein NLI96_g1479 [Meripilus lineatus]|uniref:Uncharacterized protein n=1 Tax=Meripilus lineatus TaxID=2056292 RepID=A0AAD5YMV8_9APHY|nr:hypothetical protein NLI96_g1479 [Physisporinus lineatus]